MARKKTSRKLQSRRALKDDDLATVAGGASVRIGEVTSSVGTTDGGLSPGILGGLVGAVTSTIEGLAAAAKRRQRDR